MFVFCVWLAEDKPLSVRRSSVVVGEGPEPPLGAEMLESWSVFDPESLFGGGRFPFDETGVLDESGVLDEGGFPFGGGGFPLGKGVVSETLGALSLGASFVAELAFEAEANPVEATSDVVGLASGTAV